MIYPALIAAAMVLAHLAPANERRTLAGLAGLLALNWLFCEWTYSDNPPQRLIGVGAPDLWSLADMLVGAVAITVSRRWWAWALWAISTIQVGFHAAHGVLPDATYTFWLDRLLDAQISVFLLIGGQGVADRLLGIPCVFGVGSLAQGRTAKTVSW